MNTISARCSHFAVQAKMLRISKLIALLFFLATWRVSAWGAVNFHESTTASIFAFLDVTGKVNDEKGVGIPGASIKVKGKNIATVTDVSGNFTIKNLTESDILVITYTGYEIQEISATTKNINVQLVPLVSNLNEVIVVGYGTKLKGKVTGAISQVSGAELSNAPVAKLGQALQGVIPNLNITNASGNPNSNPSFNVRGITSLSGGDALVLVDGMPSSLNLINPVDVESVTVLKDAASAAIYGARGAFGVILVTTKKGGKDQKAKITYSGGLRFNRPTFLPDVLNTSESMVAANKAQMNSTGTVRYSEEQIKWVNDYVADPVNNPSYHMLPNGKIFWNASPNIIQNMVRNWAPGQDHSLNLTGGTAKTSYYLSAGYLKQEGIFKTGTDVLKRYSFTANVNTDITNWFKFGAKVNLIANQFNEPHAYPNKGSDWWEQMTRGEPQILFPIKTPANSPVGEGIATENFANFLESGSRKIANALDGIYSVNAEVRILPELKVSGNFSYSNLRNNIKENQIAFPYIRDTWIPQISGTSPSFIQRNFNNTDFFASNIFANYSKTFAQKHTLNGLIGYNSELTTLYGDMARKQDLVSDMIPVLNLATGIATVSDYETSFATQGVFSRISYDYMDKYLVEFNGRYDGTSKFPSGKRFGFFPSVSIGWRLTKESFMKSYSTVLKDLKFRASYGSLGNQNIANNFPYIGMLTATGQVPFIMNGALPFGLNSPGLVSRDLTWEKVATLDFGADANLFGKLDLGFDWYKRITSGMLVAGERLPAVLGTAVPQRNGAELKTKGFEFSAKWTDHINGKLKYSLGVVLSNFSSEITKFDNNPNMLISNYYVGQKIGEIWGYETLGIFQNSTDVAKAANQDQLGNSGKWSAGDVQYADLNGDGVINPGANTVSNPGDRKIIGNDLPKYQYGITGNISWKGFDFNFFIQGVGKRNTVPTGAYFWGGIENAAAVGTREVYANSWSVQSPDAYYPIYKAGSTFNILPQTRYLQNSAYLRLKNVTLGYTVPEKTIQKLKLYDARIFLSAQNVWEYSQLKGNFDPEASSSSAGIFYPLQRVLSFGLQLSL